MKCSCLVINLVRKKSSLLTHTRLWNNRVMLLFTSSIHRTKSPYFQISFSSYLEFPPKSWCYLSIISGEKLIFFFKVHREFYGVGKEQFQILQKFIIHNVCFCQGRIFIYNMDYLCFGIFLNECYSVHWFILGLWWCKFY